MILHVAGITPWNSILQMVGAGGWIYVGYKCNERAIILNFLPQFAIIIPNVNLDVYMTVLIAGGDSFTYGSELPSQEHTWANLLASRKGWNICNTVLIWIQ